LRIAFGADDENATTRAVLASLTAAGHDVIQTSEPLWPRVGAAVGRAVASGAAELGVVLCWTGTGVSIAANKIHGVRAALAWEPWIATSARRWNDANVLAMSLQRLTPKQGVATVTAFLAETEVDQEERANIATLTRLEEAGPETPLDAL
jgi:ribose 5-phosphate isomerase B